MKTDNTFTLSDGRRLGYAEYGDPKGKPLFFLHGWPGSRLRGRFYDKLAKSLKIRLISPDRPGFGISDYKVNRTLLDYPSDLVELADKLKINKFSVVGVSGGGPYAAVCAYKIPQRLTKTGVVVGAAPMYLPKILEGMSWIYKVGWINYANWPVTAYIGSFFQYVTAYFLPDFYFLNFRSKADRKIAKENSTDFKRITREAFRQGIKGPARDLVIYSTPWGFDLKKIKAKVYLWYGEDDKNVPLVMGEYFKNQIRGSKLITYPKEGHLISITHVKEIFKTLR